jgi:hypothetical protein
MKQLLKEYNDLISEEQRSTTHQTKHSMFGPPKAQLVPGIKRYFALNQNTDSSASDLSL